MKSKVMANYAGFTDKATGKKEPGFLKITKVTEAKSIGIKDFKSCTKLMREWLNFFDDGHLYLSIDDTTEYHETYPPSFEKINPSTCLLKVPSFSYDYKDKLDSIILKHHNDIVSTKNLIIDLTGNGGGSDNTYAALLPYVYSGTAVLDMVEFFTSPDNISQYQQLADDTSKPEELRKQCREIADKMKVKPNSFVNIFGIDTFHKSPDTIYAYPQKVAILADVKNASSAEQFLLEATQSNRVIIFGTGNTSGTLDYSNLYFEYLPSEKRAVSIPTSRSLRIRKMSFDKTGLTPDIKIPIGTKDKIGYISHYLEKNK